VNQQVQNQRSFTLWRVAERHRHCITTKECLKATQKLILIGALIATIGFVALAADQPATKTDTSHDKLLGQKVAEVWFNCQKIHPGMTRADLERIFRRNTGGVAVPDSTPLPFREHQTYDYRPCNDIMIDVDFQPSDSKQERPTDVIAGVSKPYIDCSPRN
jgi:hypothetical protein